VHSYYDVFNGFRILHMVFSSDGKSDKRNKSTATVVNERLHDYCRSNTGFTPFTLAGFVVILNYKLLKFN